MRNKHSSVTLFSWLLVLILTSYVIYDKVFHPYMNRVNGLYNNVMNAMNNAARKVAKFKKDTVWSHYAQKSRTSQQVEQSFQQISRASGVKITGIMHKSESLFNQGDWQFLSSRYSISLSASFKGCLEFLTRIEQEPCLTTLAQFGYRVKKHPLSDVKIKIAILTRRKMKSAPEKVDEENKKDTDGAGKKDTDTVRGNSTEQKKGSDGESSTEEAKPLDKSKSA